MTRAGGRQNYSVEIVALLNINEHSLSRHSAIPGIFAGGWTSCRCYAGRRRCERAHARSCVHRKHVKSTHVLPLSRYCCRVVPVAATAIIARVTLFAVRRESIAHEVGAPTVWTGQGDGDHSEQTLAGHPDVSH